MAPGVTAKNQTHQGSSSDPSRSDTSLVVPRAEAQGSRVSLPAPTCCVCLPISTYSGAFHGPTCLPPGSVQGRKEKEMQRDAARARSPRGSRGIRGKRRTERPKQQSRGPRSSSAASRVRALNTPGCSCVCETVRARLEHRPPPPAGASLLA